MTNSVNRSPTADRAGANLSESLARLSLAERTLLEQKLLASGAVAAIPTIPTVSRELPLPLSFGQERIWFLDRFAPASSSYNLPTAIRFDGHVDVKALSQAVDAVVARHEPLRARFANSDGRPVQQIDNPPKGVLQVEDASALDEEAVSALIRSEADAPFDLEHGPLIRVRLLRRSQARHVLVINIHHIASDGWSQSVFRSDLAALYDAFRFGDTAQLPALTVGYIEYAAWQRARASVGFAEDLAFWKAHLRGAPVAIDLLTDWPRPAAQTFRGSTVRFCVPDEIYGRLTALARARNATLFMTLLSAFGALLARYANQTDIVIGTPVAARSRREFEPLVGFFVNTLALHLRAEGAMRFVDLLDQTRASCIEAFRHDELPFEQLVEALKPPRDASRNPIFQVEFSVQPHVDHPLVLGDVVGDDLVVERQSTQFDLALDMMEERVGLVGYLQYNTALFAPETMQRMVRHFENLLHSIVDKPECPVGQLAMVTADERDKLVADWSPNDVTRSRECCAHELFEAQVRRAPSAVAVVSDNEQVSYKELNRRANRLARHLRSLKVTADVRVGICAEHSVEMVAAVLAILKAGGACVSLDPRVPVGILEHIILDSKPRVILSHGSLAMSALSRCGAAVRGKDLDVIDLKEDAEAWRSQSAENPRYAAIEPQNLAQVDYGWASAGRPQGVMVEHGNLVSLVYAMCRVLDLTREDCVVSLPAQSLEPAGLEICLPLVGGARLVLLDGETIGDGAVLNETLARHAATVMQATPAAWRDLKERGWTGNADLKAVCNGEGLTAELVAWLSERVACLWTGQGLMETTFYSSIALAEATHLDVASGRIPLALGR